MCRAKRHEQLTDHKDDERLIYCRVAVGGFKVVNPALGCFQPHEPQLMNEPKHVRNPPSAVRHVVMFTRLQSSNSVSNIKTSSCHLGTT